MIAADQMIRNLSQIAGYRTAIWLNRSPNLTFSCLNLLSFGQRKSGGDNFYVIVARSTFNPKKVRLGLARLGSLIKVALFIFPYII